MYVSYIQQKMYIQFITFINIFMLPDLNKCRLQICQQVFFKDFSITLRSSCTFIKLYKYNFTIFPLLSTTKSDKNSASLLKKWLSTLLILLDILLLKQLIIPIQKDSLMNSKLIYFQKHCSYLLYFHSRNYLPKFKALLPKWV